MTAGTIWRRHKGRWAILFTDKGANELRALGVKLRVAGGRKVGRYGKRAVRSYPNKRKDDLGNRKEI